MDTDGEDATPPLLLAAYAGDVHALRRAIADGADVNVEGEVDEDGDGPYTALHWLACHEPTSDQADRFACISALLDAEADVNKLGARLPWRRRKSRLRTRPYAPAHRLNFRL